MNKKILNIIIQSLLLVLAIILVWMSIKGIDRNQWKHIKETCYQANYWLTIPATIVVILSHWIRALRWELLIRANNLSVRKTNTFFATMIGYFANAFVPRLGEVLRCSTLAKQEKVASSNLLGTIVAERAIDAICLIGVFIIALLLSFSTFSAYAYENFWLGIDKQKLAVEIILITTLLIGLFFFIAKVLAKSNNKIIKTIVNFFIGIKEGIIAIKHLKHKKLFLSYTFFMWLLYALAMYIAFFAFNETVHLSFIVALILLAFGSVGMIITPNGIGAYPLLIQEILIFYNISSETGFAMGWLMWILETAVVIILGGIGIIRWYALVKWGKKT